MRPCAFALLLAAVTFPAHAQPGVYQSNPDTLFYLPMDGPNAGAPESCSINNSGLISYVADRFGHAKGATKVAAEGSYADKFYIICNNTQIAASPSTSFTLGYWAQISHLPNDGVGCTRGCDYRIFTIIAANGTSLNGCEDKYLTLDIGAGGTTYPQACQGGLNGDQGLLLSSTPVIDGGWHDLIWVFDHTNNLITLYLDGTQNATAPLPDPPFTPENTQYVAGSENGSYALNGNLDDVWIEDHAWTPGEVAQYYYGLSNTIDISESAGTPTTTLTPAFMAQLQQAGVTNVIVKAPQPCPNGTLKQQQACQYAIKVAGEQFTAFKAGFQVAAYCYLNFGTGSPTGDVQAANCIKAIPPAAFSLIHFIALDVEDLPVPSQSNAITIISAAANTIAPQKKVLINTNASFWNAITGNTSQFSSSYQLWNTTVGQGGFRDYGPPLTPSTPSTQYCGSGIPNLQSFTPFGGWTAAQNVGSQYYAGPYTQAEKCKPGGSLFGVSMDFDVFAPSQFQ